MVASCAQVCPATLQLRALPTLECKMHAMPFARRVGVLSSESARVKGTEFLIAAKQHPA